MKANELMIGDWVKHLCKAFRVTSISGQHIYMEDSNGEKEDQHVSCLEPIPITAEILENNRFKRWENTGFYQYHGNNFDIGYYIGLKRCGIYKSKEYDLEFKKDFLFVHELQHALRLCKIDKEIVL